MMKINYLLRETIEYSSWKNQLFDQSLSVIQFFYPLYPFAKDENYSKSFSGNSPFNEARKYLPSLILI